MKIKKKFLLLFVLLSSQLIHAFTLTVDNKVDVSKILQKLKCGYSIEIEFIKNSEIQYLDYHLMEHTKGKGKVKDSKVTSSIINPTVNLIKYNETGLLGKFHCTGSPIRDGKKYNNIEVVVYIDEGKSTQNVACKITSLQ